MTFGSPCADRELVLKATGHVLVKGGPGCGKTTLALAKAEARIQAGLKPCQKVLFLSFSRAAVARVVEAARDDAAHGGLPPNVRRSIDIETFHSFCWQLVRGHGYLLGAPRPLRLLSPHDERARRDGKKDEDPLWRKELERLFVHEGLIAFDLFAAKALALLEGSSAVRRLVANRYPLIIVDEAQDTGTDQWACLQSLAGSVQLVCLADLDQQIYDFRPDVSPDRLEQIMEALTPLEIDLGVQNNRSPGMEIVRFGNDILACKPRGAPYKGVSRLSFVPSAEKRDKAIRSAVGIVYKRVKDATGKVPKSVGYLTNWGKGVVAIARALQGGGEAKPVQHRVVMDEAEVLLATRVIAACLEPVTNLSFSVATALDLIRDLFRARGDVAKATLLARCADAVRKGKTQGSAKCPKGLRTVFETLQANPLSGNPAQDWLTLRRLFEKSDAKELQVVARLVIYLMGFNRGRRIADSLAEVWQRRGSYENGRVLVEAAITEDQIVGSEGNLTGINVMTIHKSKGKEFDGVIILHLGQSISPLSPPYEQAPHAKSRRLLRVAVTRARHHVLLLTDAYDQSPVLKGHKLGA